MEQTINERWVQFAYLNAKGNITKTALKIRISRDIPFDTEFTIPVFGHEYIFSCIAEETKSNNDGTVDKIYVIASPAS